MTDHDHDDIARRLRETGTVPAPDRLRDDVMSQVRAEPHPRRQRRSFLVPVLPYAAAAAAIVVAVLAVSHLGGGSGGMSSGAAGASGGGSTLSPEAGGKAAGPLRDSTNRNKAVFSLTPYAARGLAHEAQVTATKSPRAIVLAVPRSLYADYKQRLRKIEQRTHGRDTIRVILRPRG